MASSARCASSTTSATAAPPAAARSRRWSAPMTRWRVSRVSGAASGAARAVSSASTEPRRRADGVEQRPVPAYELLGHAGEGRIRAARLGGSDRDHDPRLGPCDPSQLAAERRLADPCRAPHSDRSESSARLRPQHGGGPRQLELAAHEGGLGDAQIPRRIRRRWPPCRRSAGSSSRVASAVRSRPYQRIAAGRLPAANSCRINSRYAGSSVGATSTSRSPGPLARSSSTYRDRRRSRGAWVHSSYRASGSSSPA